MPKVTAVKMLQLINVTIYQGKLTYLMIGFLYQTRTGFSEIVSLTIGDVYRHGCAKKAVSIGQGPRQRTQILDEHARKTIDDLIGSRGELQTRPAMVSPAAMIGRRRVRPIGSRGDVRKSPARLARQHRRLWGSRARAPLDPVSLHCLPPRPAK